MFFGFSRFFLGEPPLSPGAEARTGGVGSGSTVPGVSLMSLGVAIVVVCFLVGTVISAANSLR